jgi:uncharacterized membrane protein
MNLAHIHLLLNHFPTIGFGIALALFIVALVGKNDELKRTSFVIFFLIAAIAIPTYLSGNAAVETLCAGPEKECPPGVSQPTIRAHEDAALIAFALMELTGFIAWLGLWQARMISRTPAWSVAAVLLVAIGSFGLMARAANLGGEIRHPEIVATPPAEPSGEAVQSLARGLGEGVNANQWIWPACEALHFIGLCILFTVVLLMDLRILGIAKKLSFPALYQLLPLGMLGFAMNLVTGMVFFLAAPEQYTQNPIFYWKIVFVMLGAVNVLYFMLLDEPWSIGEGDNAPIMARLMAGSAIVVWVGVLFFGHMLPFLGNAF